ncbi:MAG: acyl carrier protein [Sedimentisphaerales bacterium]|jgi:acyl carrier protein
MIKDRLEVIFRQSFEIEKFTEDLSIDNVPGWDSMAHVGLILALQKEFAVSIPPVDALELTSVSSIIKYLVNQGVSSK